MDAGKITCSLMHSALVLAAVYEYSRKLESYRIVRNWERPSTLLDAQETQNRWVFSDRVNHVFCTSRPTCVRKVVFSKLDMLTTV